MLLIAATAEAEQWYLEPRASLYSFQDDNLNLSILNPVNTVGATASLEGGAGRRTENTEIEIRAKLLSSAYTDASEYDTTNAALKALGSYQTGRSQFKLEGQFDYDSTLTSEVATTGYVQTDKRRQRAAISPTWIFKLTPRTSVETAFSYEDVSYEDVDLIPLFDYNFSTAAATLVYDLTERSQLFGRVSADRYDASQVDTQSDSRGIEIGASHQLSETLSITLFAGARNTTAQTPTWFGVQETDNSGPLFEVKLKKSLEVGEFSVTADRSLLPSSNGSLLDTTSLSMSFAYPLNEAWKFRFDASGYRNRSPDEGIGTYDRDYLSFAPHVEHRLTEEIFLDVSYRYRWQRYEISATDAASNAIYLTVNYAPRRTLIGH